MVALWVGRVCLPCVLGIKLYNCLLLLGIADCTFIPVLCLIIHTICQWKRHVTNQMHAPLWVPSLYYFIAIFYY